MSVAVIVPTYGQFGYAAAAVESAYAHTPGCRVFLLDDHSPGWKSSWLADLKERFPDIRSHHFGKNGGLTRSWNEGLRWAREFGCAYTVVSNSDVLFTPGWFEPLVWALDNGADLVGPMTNAPGHQPKQQVTRQLPDYELTDHPDKLRQTAERLAAKNPKIFTPLRVNGFCMIAKTVTWWEGAFDESNVFNPKFKLTRNEDELQGRWKKAGRVTAVVPGSFVFHYRGVTRKGATKGREGQGWFRNPQTPR
jgi:GT2 family glycosyltransferase